MPDEVSIENIWDLALGNKVEENKPLPVPSGEAKPVEEKQSRWILPPLPTMTLEHQKLVGDARRQANTERLQASYLVTRNAIREQKGLAPLPKTAQVTVGQRLANRAKPINHIRPIAPKLTPINPQSI